MNPRMYRTLRIEGKNKFLTKGKYPYLKWPVKVANSWAFFIIPVFLLENVVYLLFLLLMNSILTLTLPLVFFPGLGMESSSSQLSSSSSSPLLSLLNLLCSWLNVKFIFMDSQLTGTINLHWISSLHNFTVIFNALSKCNWFLCTW